MSLSRDEFATSLARVQEAARRAGADCELLITRNVGGDVEAVATGKSKDYDCRGKVLIRRVPREPGDAIETRIAVIGNVDAGKSSLVGVLVKGDLDDGRGKARVNLFRHKHEIETGRTSSVGLEILGFDSKGRVVQSDTPGSE
jgi:GTPase